MASVQSNGRIDERLARSRALAVDMERSSARAVDALRQAAAALRAERTARPTSR
jgi:hypothetical protein